jgi:hypothetical protein
MRTPRGKTSRKILRAVIGWRHGRFPFSIGQA